jgi:hypothetical protein
MKYIKTFEAYNAYDEYEQGEFDFDKKEINIGEIYKQYKNSGIYVFSLKDENQYEFEDYLKNKDEEYGTTSQIGTDVTFYDLNGKYMNYFNRKK